MRVAVLLLLVACVRAQFLCGEPNATTIANSTHVLTLLAGPPILSADTMSII